MLFAREISQEFNIFSRNVCQLTCSSHIAAFSTKLFHLSQSLIEYNRFYSDLTQLAQIYINL